jgi:hypothetical protein
MQVDNVTDKHLFFMKILMASIIALEIGLLFIPGGVIDHSKTIIKYGCDKNVVSAEYYPLTGSIGGGTYYFCGANPPPQMNPFYQLFSNRRVQMIFAWLVIGGSIYSNFLLGKELNQKGVIGGFISIVVIYLFGTALMVF